MPRKGDKDLSKYETKPCEECGNLFERRIAEHVRFCSKPCRMNNTNRKKKGVKRSETEKKRLSVFFKNYWATHTHPNLGKKLTKEQLEAHHKHTIRGEKHYKWKGGKIISGNGYRMIIDRSHPSANRHGQVFEHRVVMEKHIGRFLDKKERVHHINKIKTDNRIENLILFKNTGEHIHWHMENDPGFKERTRRYHRSP